jgi:hypothetical protein
MERTVFLAKIHYTIARYDEYLYSANTYDAVGLIYVHMPSIERSIIHKQVKESLKPGGVIILEAFDKEQLGYTTGGPKDIDMLYTKEDIASDFEGLHIILLEKSKINLQEVTFHSGDAVIVRMLAKAV